MARKKKTIQEPQEETVKELDIDCCTCAHRYHCVKFQENSFCTKWELPKDDSKK